jgi:hypothetical protein
MPVSTFLFPIIQTSGRICQSYKEAFKPVKISKWGNSDNVPFEDRDAMIYKGGGKRDSQSHLQSLCRAGNAGNPADSGDAGTG